jgi:dienelactone hydrolase
MTAPASSPATPAGREDRRFSVHGTECAAWFYPAAEAGPAPCVVLAHGFDGVREQALADYAGRFVAHGLAAFVFDYRHFGDSGGEPRQLYSARRQLEDWRAAIAYVRGLDGVDGDRIGLWGTSNSGGHVLKAAAEDGGIRAVAVQAPFISGFAQLRALPPTHGLALLWAGLRDVIGARFGRPVTIKAVGQPYSLAVTTTPDALSGLARITPSDGAWRNAVLARFALGTTFYSAARAGRRLRCPLLVCVADRDNVIPAGPARALAARAPQGRLRRYDTTHFGLYYGRGFAAAARDQAEFLRHHLRARPLKVAR